MNVLLVFHTEFHEEKVYGSNYDRLRQIKDKGDPDSVFFAYTAVDSEDWVIDGSGRLVKAQATGSKINPYSKNQ